MAWLISSTRKAPATVPACPRKMEQGDRALPVIIERSSLSAESKNRAYLVLPDGMADTGADTGHSVFAPVNNFGGYRFSCLFSFLDWGRDLCRAALELRIRAGDCIVAEVDR